MNLGETDALGGLSENTALWRFFFEWVTYWNFGSFRSEEIYGWGYYRGCYRHYETRWYEFYRGETPTFCRSHHLPYPTLIRSQIKFLPEWSFLQYTAKIALIMAVYFFNLTTALSSSKRIRQSKDFEYRTEVDSLGSDRRQDLQE